MLLYKLKDWINQDLLDLEWLAVNPNAIQLIETIIGWNSVEKRALYPDKINWNLLSENPNAMHLLEAYPDRIDWTMLAANPSALRLIETKIGWNQTENRALYPDNIDWLRLVENPNALHLIKSNINNLKRYKNMGSNTNPEVLKLIENLDDIYWWHMCRNPAAIQIFETKIEWDLSYILKQNAMISANPAAIQVLLGHESLDTTTRYVHASDRFAEETHKKYHPVK